MESRLRNKIAVVTGAAGGIGRAITERIRREGAQVLAVDKDAQLLRELELTTSVGDLVVLAADVASREAPDAIFSKCLDAFGRIDVLVNNAGRGNWPTVLETTDDDLDLCFDINFKSVFRLSRAAARLMSAGGNIVNIASSLGVVAAHGNAPYAAAKAAVLALTRQMAVELGPVGIRVNAIAPGLTVTPGTRARLENPVYQKYYVAGVPLGRTAKADEIAAGAAFLCSDDASFITGEVIMVDGGYAATRYRERSN